MDIEMDIDIFKQKYLEIFPRPFNVPIARDSL